MAKFTVLSGATEDPAPYWRAFARILVRGRLRRMGLIPMPAELMQKQEEDEKTGR